MRYLIAVLLAGAAFAQNPNTAIFPGSAPNPPLASIKAASTLASGMDATQTTATLVSGTAYRIPGVFTVELERIYCTGKTGDQLTGCTRGFDGTTGATHASGKTVSGYISSWGWNQVAAELAAVAAGDFGSRTVKGAGFEGSAGTAFSMSGAEQSALATPAAGAGACWFDSTEHGLNCKLNNSATVYRLTSLSTAALKTRSFGFILGADDGSALVDTNDQADIWANALGLGVHITSVTCYTDSGTSTINLARNDGSAANILASSLTCSTAGATTTTFTSGEDAISDGHRIDLVVVAAAASGTPKRITVMVRYTVD